MDIYSHQWVNMPRVVFVIGFSQEYETLVEDVKHWLVRAQGLAKVVILVNLIEAPVPPATGGYRSGNQARVRAGTL